MKNKWTSFETYVQNMMMCEHIAGVAVAVSKNNEIIYQKGFGVRNIKTKEPVTPETIFGIASITKSFTAMAIVNLEKEGKLSIDDPVIKFLPELRMKNVKDVKEIKIHHLLSHTTGFAPIERREELNKLQEHIQYLSNYNLDIFGKPGEYFSYSNDGFLLLGAIIERITGKLYRRYITETILNPLNMYRSTFSLEELSKYENVTIPYDFNNTTQKMQKSDWPDLGNYEVGGGIRSTVLDLIKYGQQYVGKSSNKIMDINKHDLEKMWTPVYQLGKKYYGYALQITPDYGNNTLVEHGGGQPGVSSNFGFIPEKNIVVAVLTNVSHVPANDIWLKAINTAIDLPLEKSLSYGTYYDATRDDFLYLVGTYSSDEGDSIKIYLEDDIPKLEVDGLHFDLKALDEKTLFLDKYNLPIKFYANRSGEIWGVLYGLRILRRNN